MTHRETEAAAAAASLTLREKAERLVAHLLVWPMRLVTPVCVVAAPLLLSALDPSSSSDCSSLALALSHYFPSFTGSWLHLGLTAYSVGDVLFYVWFRKTLKSAQKLTSPPVIRLDVHQRVWRAMLHSALPGESCFHFLSTWFPIPIHLVGREDVRNCLAVGFFGMPLDKLRLRAAARRAGGGQEVAEVDRMLAVVEQHRGGRFPPESPPDMPRLHMLPVDPVPALHRPLLVYLAAGMLDLSSDFFIWCCGFRRLAVGGMSFWVRRAEDGRRKGRGGGGEGRRRRGEMDKEEPPIVFVHGVGLGLVTYLPFLQSLFRRSRHRAVMLLELPHVSMKLHIGVDSFPGIQQIADLTEQAMQQLRLPPALWVCHSLGTFVFAGINRLKPHLIDAVVLIDPVCFLLWEATTMDNFCYCEPSTPMQIVQQYHVCKELLISWYFQRHFYFSDAVLLREDVPQRALVVISQSDNIYNTSRVIEYLRAGDVDMKLFPSTQHGGWIVNPQQTSEIVSAIVSFYIDK